MLTITHTHAEGTMIEGTARGDGSADVLKRAGWRWSRNLGAWYVRRSRDHAPQTAMIERVAEQLRQAGHEVTVQICDDRRTFVEVEADRIARESARAEALAAKAERHQQRADAADARADDAHHRLPPFGEPIKVGHHSEGRHRRDLDRADRTMRQAAEAHDDAKESARRARVAASSTGARYNPVTVGNKIAKIEAECRSLRRHLEGYTTRGGLYAETFPPATGARRERIETDLAAAEDQLAYWRGVRAQQAKDGQIVAHDNTTISTGDAVKVRGDWRRVVRVNAKSVSVETGYSWTDRVSYHEVQDHRPAAQTHQG